MKSLSDNATVLDAIRRALATSNTTPPPALPVSTEPFFTRKGLAPAAEFEQVLTALQGEFAQINSLNEAINSIKQYALTASIKSVCCTIPSVSAILESAGLLITEDLGAADAAITDCECLVVRTGSIVLSAVQSCGRSLPVFAPIHIVLAYKEQLMDDVEDALGFLLDKYKQRLPSSLHFASGPSRTGDIEKTLVTGVHGPGKVLVLLLP